MKIKINLDKAAKAMKKAKGKPQKKICWACGGKGTYLEEGDAHRSTGWVPCRHCGKQGYIIE